MRNLQIHLLRLENFRQYYGQVTIKLSTKSKEKNVSIILGTNGAGKTNLMNAISWCLYREEPSLEKNQSGEGIYPTINVKAWDETQVNTTTYIKVDIELGYDGKPKYRFARVLELTVRFTVCSSRINETTKLCIKSY